MSVTETHPSTQPSGRFWIASYPEGMANEIAPLGHSSIGALVESSCAQFADRADAERGELAVHDLADAVDARHRERREEVEHFVRLDHEQAVGLAPVGGDLGEEFRGRDAGRRSEIGFLANLRADRFGDRGGRIERGLRFGDVEIGLVERERFDEVGVAQHDLAHGLRDGLVAREVGRHEHGIGTQAFGARGRHRRAHAEHARLVTCGADDRALPAPGDDDGPAAQRGIVALLDRGVERVHVDVDELAHASPPMGARMLARRRGARARGDAAFSYNASRGFAAAHAPLRPDTSAIETARAGR